MFQDAIFSNVLETFTHIYKMFVLTD